MSRYQLSTVPRVDDLSLDVSDDVLRGLHHKEPSEASSSNSSYSPYTYPIEIKQNSDKDGSAFANSLISQSLNADGTPKRPMNAFMIFARKRRPEVSAANQMMRTGEISKILSKEWNAMDITQKQFYLDQAKRLKDTFNSKYPDYVYRRRPNNSRKKRRTDAGSPPDPDELSGGDPSPVEIEDLDADRSPQYPFNNQELSPAVDELFTPAPARDSSTLPSHGTSYSPYPYPQSSSHRNHMSLHQQHQQHNYANSMPRSQQPSVNSSPLLHTHSSLRSAPGYSTHDHNTLSYPLSSGLPTSSSQSQNGGYYGYQNERQSTNNPHGASLSNATAIQSSMNSHWIPPPLSNTQHQQQYAQYPSRERAYTTTALPAMKSSFPSPDVTQLSLPPMLPHGATRSLRRPASGGHTSHGGSGVGNYLPSFFSSNSSTAVSPAASSNGGHGYFPSPPSTSSSTSAGTVNGVDRILTPPDLGPFDLTRNGHGHGHGEINVGYGWDRK